MELHGWGRYRGIDAQVSAPRTAAQCAGGISAAEPLIARGLGRSYGDSSLAPRVLVTRYLDHYLSFDPATGLLACQAGVSLDDILRNFVPRGWFLPVTPGTRYVTVGGAIASDVHGKNHHIDGSFCDHVVSMEMLLGNGERVTVAPQERPALFHATCGGMGLTGIILAATLRLRPIRSSNIIETTIRAANLETVLEAFETHAGDTYSVAWIDCLARGRQLGRSLLMLGEHAEDGVLDVRNGGQLPVPFDMPAGLLNTFTVRAFNTLYYHRVRHERHTRVVPFEPFFYPLDALTDWNRLYGRPGFLQYQFVLPRSAGVAALRHMLELIAASGRASFLAVLKLFGKANSNLLSFPCEGYTLALDFRAEPAVFPLLDRLDRMVLDAGGRLYLSKDARMSETMFKAGYPRWQEFEALRAEVHAIGRFGSEQSRRLGLQ